MTRAEEYRHLAEHVRDRARTVDSRNLATEWDHLADCYVLLAKQAERNEKAHQVAPQKCGTPRHN